MRIVGRKNINPEEVTWVISGHRYFRTAYDRDNLLFWTGKYGVVVDSYTTFSDDFTTLEEQYQKELNRLNREEKLERILK